MSTEKGKQASLILCLSCARRWIDYFFIDSTCPFCHLPATALGSLPLEGIDALVKVGIPDFRVE